MGVEAALQRCSKIKNSPQNDIKNELFIKLSKGDSLAKKENFILSMKFETLHNYFLFMEGVIASLPFWFI